MPRSVRLWSWLLLACLINQNFAVFAADRDRLQQLLHRFPEADLNQDGQLSLQEAKAFRDRKRGTATEPAKRQRAFQKSGLKTSTSRQAASLQAPVDGLNGLYMGHSFFNPVAQELVNRIPDSTIVDHRAYIVAAGGINGSPKYLWDAAAKREQGLQHLAAGGVDVLALTYHSPETSSLQDYQRWMDAALRKNPDIRLVLGVPWGSYIHDADLAQLSEMDSKMDFFFEQVIEPLRAAYPKNQVVFCPYGLGVNELVRRLLQADLPGVKYVMHPDPAARAASKRSGEQLVNDQIGHGGELVIRLSALIMLAVIYDYDLSLLSSQKIEKLPEIDLVAIAEKIVQRIQPYNALYDEAD